MNTTLSRRFLAGSIITGMAILLAGPSVFAFSDVKNTTPYREAITSLEDRGIIEGYADPSDPSGQAALFKPGATINRAEFMKIVIAAAFGYDPGSDPSGFDIYAPVGVPFSDVESGAWYIPFLRQAVSREIVSGYPDGTFRPDQPINFVEASKILAKAFGGDIGLYSPDWYEPFARALEGSKAIPPSIDRLEHLVTRGEMAEMMWRLTDNRTDLPAKAYLNVKYPEVSINLASDEPQRAKSCADLAAFAQEGQRQMMYPMAVDSAMATPPTMMREEMAAPAPLAGGAAEKTADYSQTNIQVEGVDEADIVKTDGTYLYIVSNGMVRVVLAHPATRMKEMSSVSYDDGFRPSDLYIDRDWLVVLGQRSEEHGPMPMMEKMMAPEFYPYYPPVEKAEVRIYDVSDRSQPALKRKVALEGFAVSSRKIEDRLYLIVNQPPRWYQPLPEPIPLGTADALLPTFDDTASGVEGKAVASCGDVVILPHIPSPQYVTVAVIPIGDLGKKVEREVILGSAENIYASLENLFLAATEWTYHWQADAPESREKTNVYRFALTDEGAEFAAKGSVLGHILNQFSMDEHDQTFRIATTQGEVWMGDSSRPSTSNLYILNMDMEVVGKIEDIAPGEQIYSARFLGDRAYMVTFRTIDPLFVIDTSDPRNPRILGKLKIPGFSDYLHPYDEDHILGFGKEAVESKDGSAVWQQGMKIALFDVSDVEHPKELHRALIGDRGTDSPLLWNHKALLFERDRDLLSFPVTVYEIPENLKVEGDPGSTYGSPVFQGAYVYRLTLEDGFELRGRITHYDEEALRKMGDYWYSQGRDIERVVRIEDALLTISNAEVQSHDLDTLKQEGGVAFTPVEGFEDLIY